MKPILTLLVGPQGSGKTTFYNSYLKDYVYISQDEQGPKAHLELYEQALKQGSAIVVDRINHTKEQRRRYISLAKQYGYFTTIREFFEPYKVCFGRIVNREGHATIAQGDREVAKRALDTYFNQYEPISYDEADQCIITERNPVMLDLSFSYNVTGRVFVVGDLHGCAEELHYLLQQVKFDFSKDSLISAGDLVDRGPEISELLLQFLEEPNFYMVQGNHDNKFFRWLRGNKVNTGSLKATIEQFEKMFDDKEETYLDFKDKPYMIKFGNNLITHAGFYPDNPLKTSREFSLYARKYDLSLRTFTNDNTKPYWYEFYDGDLNLYFGHEIHHDTWNPKKNVYALDAGCYAGGKLRMAEINREGFVAMHEIDSFQPKKEEEKTWDHMNKFEPYDKLVEQGFLNKQENSDLVLYNYSDKCTFEKHWNKYTLESRGLILNKVTGDTVARPFPKFFNLFENDTHKKLPNESYEVYEKLDGSLGILYQDSADNEWKIATRGSFKSDQAIKATEMFQKYKETWELFDEYHDYTLLFEIIYPENRVNPGARLVVNYGSDELLVLLGAIHKVTGKDLPSHQLPRLATTLNIPIAKKYDYTIDQMIALQKTLPATEEGFVVKYQSGFRVKIKGEEYCRMQRILNSITPLFIWEEMSRTDTFILEDKYKSVVPEEILPEVEVYEQKLKEKYSNILNSVYNEYCNFRLKNGATDNFEKDLGLYAKSDASKNKGLLFLLHLGKHKQLQGKISKIIRPTGNLID